MDKELAESIGAASREARKALELTQEDAAERIGVSAEFYARIERGNALPSVPTFTRIAMALGVSADTLLGFRDDSEASDRHMPEWGKPEPPNDSLEIRRLVRRLRRASSGTLRLVSLLLKELERANLKKDSDTE
ncbi:helix-turn-helix domain-containing protein [Haliangium ochraceum]|uniref:Transcriptional regulator, XRE family n=1 Tax=Haliangium ochraceum (strain DSM 14365 / JCM 11303 / SMP-2) TaxID=502025 RepID=D0LIJ6_HALO1|nr:helix-turn-helix domain-containing protein [Haliangium ochraceum]ACY18352.1 transcriptional regulator, XRE family [Haliangium ochraceum DSM 14365]